MRLNLQSDYALRLLMQLASNPDALCTIADIAQCYGISKNHLMKVANTLGRAGFIETVRGRSGGLRLARDADAIGIGAVVRKTEGDFALVECLQANKNNCLLTPSCRLKGILGEATEAFIAVLDTYTIADLVVDNSQLRDLLNLEVA
ncbi:MAG: BadM/Rrf2 family transcriptional regulator [Hyphomicrobiales bacterium]|nr:MAG: BadM/Rrf2 family transcriptional regulator [Hyphomicrobiales bacterium]